MAPYGVFHHSYLPWMASRMLTQNSWGFHTIQIVQFLLSPACC